MATDVLEVSHAGAAQLLLDRNPEKTEFSHFGPEVHGELIGLVDLRRPGCDLVGGKTHNRVAQQVGIVRRGRSRAWASG